MLIILSISQTFFAYELPDWEIFGFTIAVPSLPCLKLKIVWRTCVSYATFNVILYLFVSVFCVSAIVSSDIATMLLDRVDRCAKLPKFDRLSQIQGLVLHRLGFPEVK